ncbi:MAG: chemotaxis protein CheB, partial [Pseudomonadota bacterium]
PDSQASGVLGVPSHAPPGAGPDKPIDRLFGSLARLAGNRAVGVIMSGSGDDGAVGIARIHQAGGVSLVQEINNCMDPSMPLAVLQRGIMAKMVPDYLMAEFIAKM